ncbi:flavin reductase family protein [Actinomadura sp. ATCC 31491]|uniref:Flavin reductase family protein n=2 Tax=Actinomadura luzonensis TaxID=2805427 RepID=A0ABT0FSQ3_9ACTN|nr:flavin reductase family protein [Actinomadura luzonensis]
MARFATGVAVVTTRHGGTDHAMTANSLTSVSLDPPLVLFCVRRGGRFHDAVLAAGAWGVSVLPASMEDAGRFFARPGRPEAGAATRWPRHRGRSGALLFDGALAVLEAETRAVHDGGDHVIVVGVVTALGTPSDGRPLLYQDSRYRTG